MHRPATFYKVRDTKSELERGFSGMEWFTKQNGEHKCNKERRKRVIHAPMEILDESS